MHPRYLGTFWLWIGVAACGTGKSDGYLTSIDHCDFKVAFDSTANQVPAMESTYGPTSEWSKIATAITMPKDTTLGAVSVLLRHPVESNDALLQIKVTDRLDESLGEELAEQFLEYVFDIEDDAEPYIYATGLARTKDFTTTESWVRILFEDENGFQRALKMPQNVTRWLQFQPTVYQGASAPEIGYAPGFGTISYNSFTGWTDQRQVIAYKLEECATE